MLECEAGDWTPGTFLKIKQGSRKGGKEGKEGKEGKGRGKEGKEGKEGVGLGCLLGYRKQFEQ